MRRLDRQAWKSRSGFVGSAAHRLRFERMPMKNQYSVCIISKREQLRDSLRVLLSSLSTVGSVEVERDFSSSLAEREDAPPALVLFTLDSSDHDSEILPTLRQIRSAWPMTRIAILVRNESQAWEVPPAEVDIIFHEGITAAQILKQIDELLLRLDP